MKLIKQSFLGLLVLVVFSWILLTSLIHQAQQGWLSSYLSPQAREQLNRLDAHAFQGYLGRGQARNLQVAGAEVAWVDWQLPWWRLAVLHPVINLQIGEEPLPWQVHLAISPSSRIKVGVEAGSLEVVQGLPVTLEGRLEGLLQARLENRQGQWQCTDLQGNWRGVVRLQNPMTVDLGQISLAPTCPEVDQLHWHATSTIDDKHELELEGRATAERWSFTGDAWVDETAEMATLLRILGWRNQGALREGDQTPGQRLEARGGGRF